MCGIAGFIDGSAVRSSELDTDVGSMTWDRKERGTVASTPSAAHRLVEFAWRFPRRAKPRHGTSKWLLRQVLCACHADRAAQDGIRHPACGVAARSLAGLDENAARLASDCGKRVLSIARRSAHCGSNTSTGVEITTTCFGIS